MLLGGQRLGGGELRVKFLANEELSKHSQKLPEQAGDWPIAQAGQPENPFFKPTGSNPLGHAAASVWYELSTRRRLVRRYKSQMDCALGGRKRSSQSEKQGSDGSPLGNGG